MQAFIVRRHQPGWREAAEEYKRTGRCDLSRILPDPLPPGFPTDMPERINLWNDTFSVDYFTCRARLEEISQQSCEQVQGAKIVEAPAVPDVVEAMREDPRSLCFFVDDDDWFAPDLITRMPRKIENTDAVRWTAPLFKGELIQRPVHRRLSRQALRADRALRHARPPINRLTALLRRCPECKGLATAGIDFLFQTNNYAVTSRYLRHSATLDEVIDHVHASKRFRDKTLRLVTLPSAVLSLTNKHPCSATSIPEPASTQNREKTLRATVERFVAEGQRQWLPPSFEWAGPFIHETLTLFREALDAV